MNCLSWHTGSVSKLQFPQLTPRCSEESGWTMDTDVSQIMEKHEAQKEHETEI